MHLIQMFIPVRDKNDRAFPQEHYAHIRATLRKNFGGLTAYNRASAEDLWKDEQNTAHHDEIVVFEVMAPELDGPWWQAYKQQLKHAFLQDEIIIRVQKVLLL